MRNETEVKEKLIDLLGIGLEERAEASPALDKLDTAFLSKHLVDHHSTRGMVAALYWVLGYEFKDIVEKFVDPSTARLGR